MITRGGLSTATAHVQGLVHLRAKRLILVPGPLQRTHPTDSAPDNRAGYLFPQKLVGGVDAPNTIP
jgi:hypothetical protein